MIDSVLLFTGLSTFLTLIGIAVAGYSFYKHAVNFSSKTRWSIFSKEEVNQGENAKLSSRSSRWIQYDHSCRIPFLFCLLSSCFWLIVGSLAGLVSSLKLHYPDLLNESALLTFGRLRSFHLNTVAYGWLSLCGLGLAIWLIPRLVQSKLKYFRITIVGIALWNICLLFGSIAILLGFSESIEWLEMPLLTDLGIALSGALLAIPVLQAILSSKIQHLYVSVWYILAALLWFPVLFVIGNLHYLHSGVEHALANWWFAHNALGLWFTPISLGIVYYILPKAIGRPIFSYRLSLWGFWSLALFYSNVGVHHLIGGPVPQWVVTVSIIMSILMLIPVVAVAVNHHFTAFAHLGKVRDSIVLRFIVLGAMMYTLASVQGSLHSLRSLSQITHFTHYTVGHAHLGAYGFVSLVLFGGVYFVLPKVTEMDWPFPKLMYLHFWLVVTGIAIYVLSLSIGGFLQGQAMLDASRAFEESVVLMKPYLIGRSVGGTLMTIGHFVFVYHVWVVSKTLLFKGTIASPHGTA